MAQLGNTTVGLTKTTRLTSLQHDQRGRAAENERQKLQLTDYTEPLDTKKILNNAVVSSQSASDSDVDFYSEPYQHWKDKLNHGKFKSKPDILQNSVTVSPHESEATKYDISPIHDDYNHIPGTGPNVSTLPTEKQNLVLRNSDRSDDSYNQCPAKIPTKFSTKLPTKISNADQPFTSKSGVEQAGLAVKNQGASYKIHWDFNQRGAVAGGANAALDVSKQDAAIYEEAWDSLEQQKKLEKNLRMARTLSTASDKFEDALEYLPEEPVKGMHRPLSTGKTTPSMGLQRTPSSSKRTVDPVTGGTYEEAWDLKKGLRNLQLMQSDKQSEDTYQEPWDTAKKQRELEERLQQVSSNAGKPSTKPSLDLGPGAKNGTSTHDHIVLKCSSLDETEVARTTNVDNFPSSQPPKRLKEDATQNTKVGSDNSSPSNRYSQSSICTVGEPINAMIPLVNQSWYHGNISRDDAERILRVCKEGSYLVRDSSDRHHYTLCIKSSRLTINIQIDEITNSRGVKCYILGKNSKKFETIPSMVDFYTMHQMPIKGAEHMTLLYPVHCQWSQADADAYG